MAPNSGLALLSERIAACDRCPRLSQYRAESRRRFPEYWSRPVAGFGDPAAALLILGLAPGMHGANRTGRVFTGDDSGRWLYGALHELGVSSEPESTHRNQPLTLRGVWISNAARCVPPGNRPTLGELDACRPWLAEEMGLLTGVRTVLALGRIAHDTWLRHQGERLSRWPFAHGAEHSMPQGPLLLDSYHPSRQNTNTGVLTRRMWLAVLARALRTA